MGPIMTSRATSRKGMDAAVGRRPRRVSASSALATCLATAALVLVLVVSGMSPGLQGPTGDQDARPRADGDPSGGSAWSAVDTAAGTGWKDYPYRVGPFAFPEDEGAHPEASSEWWYINGHLTSSDGGRYDFMVCFFQRGFLTGVLVDAGQGIHINNTQFFSGAREGLGRLYLRFGPSELYQVDGRPFVYQLNYQSPDFSLSLLLDTERMPLAVNGDGVIRMGHGVSYYYSLPDMTATGALSVGGRSLGVNGTTWMDRQWGHFSPQLDWDWFSVKLDNGLRVLVYKILDGRGPGSSLMLVSVMDTEGRTYFVNQSVDCCDAVLDYDSYWRSPETVNLYSLGWRLTVPGLGLELTVTPTMLGQEVQFPTDMARALDRKPFWEGSCSVTGTYQGEQVAGKAFAETTHDFGHIGGDLVVSAKVHPRQDGNGMLVIMVENRGGHSLDDVEVAVVAGDLHQGGEVIEIHHLNDRDNSTYISDDMPAIGGRLLFVTVDMDNTMAETDEGNNIAMVEPG